MNHDELSKKLEGLWHDSYKAPGYMMLRAVVELHKPVMGDCCEACYREELFAGHHVEVGKYPCPTIQAIEAELNR